MSDAADRIAALPFGAADKIEACNSADLRDVQSISQHRLPAAYIAFLSKMGRNAGPLFEGSEFSPAHKNKLRLRQIAERILKDSHSSFVLPDTVFVFLQHQGYQFLFFNVTDGDDPPVFLVRDNHPYPTQVSVAFSRFILDAVEKFESIAAKNPDYFSSLSVQSLDEDETS